MSEWLRYQTEIDKIDGGECSDLVRIGRSLLDIAYFNSINPTVESVARLKYFIDIPEVIQAAWEIPDLHRPYSPDQLGVVLVENSLRLVINSRRNAVHKYPSEQNVKVSLCGGGGMIIETDPIRPMAGKADFLYGRSLDMFRSRLDETLNLFELNISEVELKQAS
ncbi:MAG TPA: hypothetical protein PKC86_00605 [Candidatus Saccharibacteria bacterium]|mgnify:CR=1 FL=1|nr:hypothetical protein [Candidatus Saccharibacteria bacterium]HRN97030.1 hypothetical protein [Candidatus Saccharibacteria bacterium]HRQ07087.1 hypothetical protein [Candidatus Saccharibacteria bacterium]